MCIIHEHIRAGDVWSSNRLSVVAARSATTSGGRRGEPDNVSAAAISLAITAGGALKAYETTPLMSIEEGIEAMRKGAEVAAAYRPPTR
jgi:hypothetical protein